MFERKTGPSGQIIQPDPRDPEYVVVASVSGGKDSTAMCLWLKEQGIPHRRVCMDTGWEHKDTIPFVRDYLQEVLGPIDIIQSKKGGMVDIIKRKGCFPSRLRRWCTEELKVIPIRDYVRALAESSGREPISTMGVRSEESSKRALLPEWDFWPAGRCHMWRPLINWTEQDVIDIHHRHNIRPNVLYMRGAARVGCWPCVHARKAEIELIARTDPGRIDLLRRLEAEVTVAVKAKVAARGEEYKDGQQAWFYSVGRKKDNQGPVPIDEAVEWSRTARGGNQFEMFASETEGCVRWGLCEGTGMPGWARAHEGDE